VGAHFTLVFPAEPDRAALLDAAGAAGAEVGPIAFTLDLADAVLDIDGGSPHVFLLPGEGFDEIMALHARLHRGALEGLLDPMRPFAPHMTVAAGLGLEESARLAEEWEQRLPISGVIWSIEVIEVFPESVSSLAKFNLGSKPGRA
jgi:2'-5' RNA ligase